MRCKRSGARRDVAHLRPSAGGCFDYIVDDVRFGFTLATADHAEGVNLIQFVTVRRWADDPSSERVDIRTEALPFIP